jgi:hypothetical protein
MADKGKVPVKESIRTALFFTETRSVVAAFISYPEPVNLIKI